MLTQVDGIKIFPRQNELREGEFGNAIRGPLGIHRANMHRYWFEDAAPNFQAQFAYLRQLKRLTAAELATFTEGLSIAKSSFPGREWSSPSLSWAKERAFRSWSTSG